MFASPVLVFGRVGTLSDTPIKHCLQIEALLEAMLLPVELAILRVHAHTANTGSVSLGNAAAADAAAKNAASRCHTHAVLLASACTSEITDLDQHQAADALNHPLWESRDCSRGPDDLWIPLWQTSSASTSRLLCVSPGPRGGSRAKGGDGKTNI